MFNIDTRSVTFNLIVVNVLFFLATLMYPGLMTYLSLHYIFNTHGYVDSIGFQPYQILTHMFMHGGWMHILFNMWGLLMFGSILERVWGPSRFLFFYFTTGLGAVILNVLVQMWVVHNFTGTVDPTLAMLNNAPGAINTYASITLGASGAIFGIATAFAVIFPNTELVIFPIFIPIKAKYLMPLYILVELYSGMAGRAGDDVAHFAHLGGALFGFLLVKYWNRDKHTMY